MKTDHEKYQRRLEGGAPVVSTYGADELLEMARLEAEDYRGKFLNYAIRVTTKSTTLVVNYQLPNGKYGTAHIAL